MKSLFLSTLGLAFLFVAQANIAQADGLLDPLNVFGGKKEKAVTRRKSEGVMPKLKAPSMPKWRMPKFDWFSRSEPRQGTASASIDRKIRTNWVTPKRIGDQAGEAMDRTTNQIGGVTTATYNATANVLSPRKNIRRVQGLSQNLSKRFALPPNTLAKDHADSQQGKQPWFSAPWLKKDSTAAKGESQGRAFPRLPMMHAE